MRWSFVFSLLWGLGFTLPVFELFAQEELQGQTHAAFGASIVGRVEVGKIRETKQKTTYAGADGLAAEPPPPPLAVVYLEGTFSEELLRPPQTPGVMEQRGLQFHPSVLPVLKGSRVIFPNADPTFHNVFSYTPGSAFDLGRYRQETGVEPPAHVFETPGLVRLFCEVHEHMRGAVLVLETPIFQAVEPRSTYHLQGVPPGEYNLKLWWNGRVIGEKPVQVTATSENIQIDFP